MIQARERDAARAAFARHDWATARRCFAAAGDPVRELDTDDLAAMASACWWLGLPDENVELNAEVHRRHLDDGAREQAALVALEIGFCELLRGHDEAGAGWMGRARRIFEDVGDVPERGYLLAIDADLALQQGDVDNARELTAQVVDLGDRYAEPTLQAQGLFLSGLLALRRGRPEEAMARLDEAMLPVRAGQVAPEWAGNLYCRMMQLCHERGDLPRARSWTAITEQWCNGYLPAVVFSGICRVHRVQILQVEGDWERAEREAQRAADDLAELDTLPAGEAHYRLGEVRRLRGDLDGAEASYRRAHELGRDPLPGLALLHSCRGHGRVAASVLDAALAAVAAPLVRAPLLAARTEVALAAGERSAAARWVAELAAVAEQYRSPGWTAEARHWKGALLVARGRYAEAVQELREARAQWQRIGAPYDVARVRLCLAEAADALGDHTTAERERDEAAAALERLGAHRDLDRLRASRGGRQHVGDLSPRELEVVGAIAAGGSNREAGERLHISERTVARHLANVYAKTGVSSRTGAVNWAREHGLL